MITLRPGVPVGVEPPPDGRESVVAELDGIEVGFAVWRVESGVATVEAIASVADDDHDAAILEALRRQAVDTGLTAVVVEVADVQTGLLEALQHAPVLSRFMVKPTPGASPPLPDGFDVRDMTTDEYATWKARSVEQYAESNLARCGGNRELALQRSRESFARFLPDDAATVDTRLLTLTHGGEPVGELWIRHHRPRYRDPAPGDDQTFTFDVELAASSRGRGLGRAAMLAAERLALDVGDGQLGLNVFGDNATANGLYRSLGYETRSTVFDVALH